MDAKRPWLSTAPDAPPLSPWRRGVYGLVSFGAGVPHFLLLLYFLKFATDVLRIEPALAGGLFAASRLWDAVSDVGVGSLSDRVWTRFGRRRPWIALGGGLSAIGIVGIWAAPELAPDALAVWVGLAVLAYFTAHTMLIVPLGALGFELARDLEARNRLFTYRHVAFTLAMVVGIGAVAWLTESDDARAAARYLGVGGAVICALAVLPLVALTREVRGPERAREPLGVGLRRLATDGQARWLLAIAFIQSAGTAALTALGPFITALLLGDESALPLLLGAYVGTMLLLAPFVTRIAGRFGTRRLWRHSMLVAALGFVGLGFVQRGAVAQLVICAVLVGASDTIASVLNRTMLATACDGAGRDQATYVAARTFLEKAAYSAAVFVAGLGLSWAHYEPDAIDQTDTVLVLRALIAGVPSIAMIAAWVMSARVRLGER